MPWAMIYISATASHIVNSQILLVHMFLHAKMRRHLGWSLLILPCISSPQTFLLFRHNPSFTFSRHYQWVLSFSHAINQFFLLVNVIKVIFIRLSNSTRMFLVRSENVKLYLKYNFHKILFTRNEVHEIWQILETKPSWRNLSSDLCPM